MWPNVAHPGRIQIFDQVYGLSSAENNVPHNQNRIELAMTEIPSCEPILVCSAEIRNMRNW